MWFTFSEQRVLKLIDRTAGHGHLEHAFRNAPLHHFPHLQAQWGAAALNAFGSPFFILGQENRLKFQIDEQCAEEVIFKIILHIRWNLG